MQPCSHACVCSRANPPAAVLAMAGGVTHHLIYTRKFPISCRVGFGGFGVRSAFVAAAARTSRGQRSSGRSQQRAETGWEKDTFGQNLAVSSRSRAGDPSLSTARGQGKSRGTATQSNKDGINALSTQRRCVNRVICVLITAMVTSSLLSHLLSRLVLFLQSFA